MLINGSTDTTYWQNYVFEHATVCFLNRRVRFLKAGSDKPVANLCPSAIVYFGINVDEFVSTWKDHGAIVTRFNKVNAGLQTADAGLTLAQRVATALGLGSPEVSARRLRSRAATLRARAAVLTTAARPRCRSQRTRSDRLAGVDVGR